MQTKFSFLHICNSCFSEFFFLMALCVVAVYCFSIYTGHVPHFHGKTDVDIENKKASLHEVEFEEDSKDNKKQDK